MTILYKSNEQAFPFKFMNLFAPQHHYLFKNDFLTAFWDWVMTMSFVRVQVTLDMAC